MKQFLIVFGFLGLVACGSGSDDDLDLLGIWESPQDEDKSYLVLTRDKLISYSEDDYFACFRMFEGNINYLDESTFSFTMLEQETTLEYFIENDLLTVDDDDASLTKIAQLPVSLELCADPSLVGSIDIELEFASLPTDVELRGYRSVAIDVLFDVDGDDEWSDGDIGIELFGFEDLDDPAGDSVLSIKDLGASSYYRYQELGQDEAYSYSTTTLSRFGYRVDGRVISMSIPRLGHKALGNVDASTPIRIETYVDSCRDSLPDADGYVQGGIESYADSDDDVASEYCADGDPRLDLIGATVKVITQ